MKTAFKDSKRCNNAADCEKVKKGSYKAGFISPTYLEVMYEWLSSTSCKVATTGLLAAG